MTLNESELKALKALGNEKEEVEEIAERAGLSKDALMSVLESLQEKQLAIVEKSSSATGGLTKEGLEYLENGLPERRLVQAVEKIGGTAEVDWAADEAEFNPKEKAIALQWARKNGWIVFEKEAGKTVVKLVAKTLEKSGHEEALELVEKNAGTGGVDEALLKELVGRGLAEQKEKKVVRACITDKGRKALVEEKGKKEVVAQLTPELMKSGGWKNKSFRKYDVGAPVPAVWCAKKNPLRGFADRIREIFLNMGFSEIKGPIVESSFWNFDALFVPQDHPSRELQDTFYVGEPAEAKKPDRKYLEAVKAAHETGGKTGSRGWGYEWDEKMALRNVLRTHTTEATCRALADAAKRGEFPVKVFCIDRVFRNEAIDFKHLAEFHQVEGIVIDDGATFNDLVGILKTFFSKLGFPQIRVRPGFFPYTEPSAEVDIWYPEKNEWIELGGSGIFRPEVTRSLGIDQKVLAWGLSLERPLMLSGELADIRTFYRNDLDWIRKEK